MPEWWGGWAGTIYYNIFCVCICLKKLQNMLSVANSWNRICWSDTQRSSTGKLDYSCLNDDQKFLPHVISEHLIQMSQSGMFTRFAHCLCRFAFTVPTGLVFWYVWRPRLFYHKEHAAPTLPFPKGKRRQWWSWSSSGNPRCCIVKVQEHIIF